MDGGQFRYEVSVLINMEMNSVYMNGNDMQK